MKAVYDIKGDDIDDWAGKTSAWSELPLLLRRLLLATGDVQAIDFPGDGGVRLGGWDGMVTLASPVPFCAAGVSGWELTVESRKGKFDDDFAKRAQASVVEAASPISSYVAVTARRYRRKAKWVAEKIATGPWNGVRLLDAEDLATWLANAPSVNAWFSRKLGRPVGEFCDLDSFRDRWSCRTTRALPTRLVLAGKARSELARELRERLTGKQSHPLYVHGDTQEEATLFVAETLAQDQNPSVAARALVVESMDAWNWAATAQSGRPLILIPNLPNFDPGLASVATASVIIPVGPDTLSTAVGHLWLPPIPFEPAATILQESGWGESDAKSLLTRSGGKLPALQRLCGYVHEPGWFSKEIVSGATTLLLMGAWVQGHEADRNLVTGFGLTPEGMDSLCVELTLAPGRPVTALQERFGRRHWRWSAPAEAWSVLGGRITQPQLAAFIKAAVEVLGAEDPQYRLPAERRFFALFEGKVLPNSDELREAIACSIAWLSLANDLLRQVHGPDAGSNAARALVGKLLDDDWLRWASISEFLPVLAEASPEAFLDALEASLGSGADGVLALFREERPALSGGSPHPRLLWALETLAWNEAHVGRVALCLARLAAHDPPEQQLANRPDRSLAAILHPGVPQSATAASARISIMGTIVRYEPEVAWKVMSSTLGNGGGFASTTHRPQIVPWQLPGTLKTAPAAEYQEQVRGWVDLMLSMAMDHPGRLAQLVPSSRHWPKALETKVIDMVESFADRGVRTTELWSALREELHLFFLAGDRAGAAERFARIRTLYDRMVPSDLAEEWAWCFDGFPKIPEEGIGDIEFVNRRAGELRQEAIDRLRQAAAPLEALTRLASLVAEPIALGAALGRSSWAQDLIRLVRDGAHELPSPLVPALIVSHSVVAAPEWLAETLSVLKARGEVAVVIEALSLLPRVASTWDLAMALGDDVSERYWKTIPWALGSRSAEEHERAINQLLKVGRPGHALKAAGHWDDTISPETALRVLEALRDAVSRDDALAEVGANLRGYYLAKVFSRADASGQEERLGALEISFFKVLEDTDRPARIVFEALARQPELFAEMVVWIFREETEGDGDSAAPEEVSEEVARRARGADALLGAWQGCPGDDASTAAEREDALLAWASKVLELTTAARRAGTGAAKVAEVLVRAANATDDAWPALAARDLLEGRKYPDLARRMVTAERNTRGMTSRGALDGGDQERDLAVQYRKWSAIVRPQWPRTAAMLDDIAILYEHEGMRHDEDVAADRIRFGD